MSDPEPVEFSMEKANTASLAIGSLASSLRMEDSSLAEPIEAFSQYYNQHRVHVERDNEQRVVRLQLSPEEYRMVASLIRVEAMSRSATDFQEGTDSISRSIVADYMELAALFDEAAREASE